MRDARQAAVMVLLVQAGLISVCLSAPATADSVSSKPAAQELLDAYAKTRDRLKSSVLKHEEQYRAVYTARAVGAEMIS